MPDKLASAVTKALDELQQLLQRRQPNFSSCNSHNICKACQVPLHRGAER